MSTIKLKQLCCYLHIRFSFTSRLLYIIQNYLPEELIIDATLYSKIGRSKINPQRDYIGKLVKAFKINTDEIMIWLPDQAYEIINDEYAVAKVGLRRTKLFNKKRFKVYGNPSV